MVANSPLEATIPFRQSPQFGVARRGSPQFVPISPFSSQRARRGILMPQGKNCHETIFAAQLPRNYPHRGGNFERRKKPLLWGRGNLGGILRDNLGEGHCESKIAARHWGVNFCRKTSRCLAGPSEFQPGPICVPCFRECPDLTRFALISQETPLCRPFCKSPDFGVPEYHSFRNHYSRPDNYYIINSSGVQKCNVLFYHFLRGYRM